MNNRSNRALSVLIAILFSALSSLVAEEIAIVRGQLHGQPNIADNALRRVSLSSGCLHRAELRQETSSPAAAEATAPGCCDPTVGQASKLQWFTERSSLQNQWRIECQFLCDTRMQIVSTSMSRSLEEISEPVGYSRGAFYSNFEEKEPVFLAVSEPRPKTQGEIFQQTPEPSARIVAVREWFSNQWRLKDFIALRMEFSRGAFRDGSVRKHLAGYDPEWEHIYSEAATLVFDRMTASQLSQLGQLQC